MKVDKEFDLFARMEFAGLIKDDILSKWNQEEESLDDFLEDYISEDVIDYMNATKLNIIYNVNEHPYKNGDIIVQVEVI